MPNHRMQAIIKDPYLGKFMANNIMQKHVFSRAPKRLQISDLADVSAGHSEHIGPTYRTHLAGVPDTSGMATAASGLPWVLRLRPRRVSRPLRRLALLASIGRPSRRAKIFIGKLQEGQDSHLSYFAQSPNNGTITTRFRGRRKVAGKRSRASRQETIPRSTIGNCQSR